MSRMKLLLSDVKRRLTVVDQLRRYMLNAPLPVTGNMSDLGQIFWMNAGLVLRKWLHYLPLFDPHFFCYRGTLVRMLEIRVYRATG
jgi:hypothetical protein